MFNFLSDNLLIVCPNSYKLAILKHLSSHNLMFDIKFMSKTEYIKNLKFDYDINTVHYLVKKGYKVDNAITIIENLYYIEDKCYHNDKLDNLVKIKKELDTSKLLIYNNLFSKVLKKRKVVVYGYGKLSLFDIKIFNDALIIPYNIQNRKYNIYHFNSMQQEVEFVFQKICDLLKEGTDINNISIMNYNNEYISYFKMMEKLYNIKINYTSNDTLMGTILGKKFFDLVYCGNNKNEILIELNEYLNDNNYQLIINLLNKYPDNLLDYINEIKYDLLNIKVVNNIYQNAIKIKRVFDYIKNDEYVFFIGFNSPAIPNLVMDTNYVTNDIASLVNTNTTDELNELVKVNTLNYLSNIQNIFISYKDKSPFNDYLNSILLDYMDYEIVSYERSLNYSNLANQVVYSMYLDDLVKYGIKNKNLEIMYSNYQENDYLEYDNSYIKINQDTLLNYLNNELTLSYSSIDNFYKCGFKYYLNNILKINPFEETFNTLIGRLFHDILSKIHDDNFDLDKEYNDYLQNQCFSNKEKFFLEKLKHDLIFIIRTIKKQEFISGFTKMLYEHKIDIKLMESPYVHFKGFVDKIMYYEKDNETLVSIIDYKTGPMDIKIKNLKFGLSMQLPVYLYLVSHANIFTNIRFTGFYLEHILDINVMKNKEKKLDELKENNLKLTGYSTDNLSRLSIFDSTYNDSTLIKGIKTTKDGNLAKTANVLTDDEVQTVLRLTEKKIRGAMKEILEANFQINPKILNRENVACKYCKFKDICYYKDKDLVYLDSDNN